MLDLLKDKKRIIIKIGSALLVESGKIRNAWLKSMVEDIKYLRQKLNLEIIIVSSGSIALGKSYLNKIGNKKLSLEEKQSAAAIGQISLMSSYQAYFAKYKINVAQILLTGSESSERSKYLNARNTFNTLLKNDIIPIVNENDTITTEEIKIGDNDRLAARVAQMVDADLLILFSDVNGLYDKNPKTHKDAKFIPLVSKITKEIEKMASGAVSSLGTGGMSTKIVAAKMAFNSNCDTVIASGIVHHPIKSASQYTIFKSGNNKISSKKKWIIDCLNPKGEIAINQCAIEALIKGSSLLPIGVEKISGHFFVGDIVAIKDINNNHIASGAVSYSSVEAKLVIGKKTPEVKKILGKKFKDELINRDNLALIK